jgi:predicted ester cyclase
MSTRENKEIVRRYWEGRFNQKDYDVVDQLVASAADVEQQKSWLDQFHKAWGDVHVTLDEVVAEGDMVAVHFTFETTHTGEWEGFAPTGKRGTARGMALCWLQNGKIVKDDVAYSDGYELLAKQADVT